MYFLCHASSEFKTTINPKEHSEHKWITLDQLNSFDLIGNIRNEIIKACEEYKAIDIDL